MTAAAIAATPLVVSCTQSPEKPKIEEQQKTKKRPSNSIIVPRQDYEAHLTLMRAAEEGFDLTKPSNLALVKEALRIVVPDHKISNDIRQDVQWYNQRFPLPSVYMNHITNVAGQLIPLDTQGLKIVIREAEMDEVLEKTILSQMTLVPSQIEAVRTEVLRRLNEMIDRFPDLHYTGEHTTRRNGNISVVSISPDDRLHGSFSSRVERLLNWLALNDAYRRSGVRILSYDGEDLDGVYREVYTRDRAVIIGQHAYIPDFRKRISEQFLLPPEEQSLKDEVDSMEQILESEGLQVHKVEGAWFQGGNVIAHSSRTLIFGRPVDEDNSDAQKLLDAINQTQPQEWRMVVLPHVQFKDRMGNLAFYHTDTYVGRELPNGKIMFYAAATTPQAASALIQAVGSQNVIPITAQEATRYVTNYSVLGTTIILPVENPRIRFLMSRAGYGVISPADYNLGSFIDDGMGGPSCKSLNFRTQRAQRTRPIRPLALNI